MPQQPVVVCLRRAPPLGVWAGKPAQQPQASAPATASPGAGIPSTSGAPAMDGSGPLALPESASFSDCKGIYTTFYWPGTSSPAPHFPGWDPDPRHPASEIREIVMECARLGWGAIERGPIRFVLEYANNFRAPTACITGTALQSWILHAMWTDDAEVARRLATSEGLPVNATPISVVGTDVAAAYQADVSWGGPASTLTSDQESAPNQPAILGAPARLIWRNGAGVSYLDFGGDKVSGPTYPNDRDVRGTMHAPMLMATLNENYVGTGFGFAGGQFGGEIVRFKDLQCASRSS